MAARTLETGKTYQVKLTSAAWVAARFERQTETGGLVSRHSGQRIRKSMKRYHFKNLASGRAVVLKSMAKVRAAAPVALERR